MGLRHREADSLLLGPGAAVPSQCCRLVLAPQAAHSPQCLFCDSGTSPRPHPHPWSRDLASCGPHAAGTGQGGSSLAGTRSCKQLSCHCPFVWGKQRGRLRTGTARPASLSVWKCARGAEGRWLPVAPWSSRSTFSPTWHHRLCSRPARPPPPHVHPSSFQPCNHTSLLTLVSMPRPGPGDPARSLSDSSTTSQHALWPLMLSPCTWLYPRLFSTNSQHGLSF